MKINAKWVTFPGEPSVAAFTFKKSFKTDKKIKKATAVASALGIYALYIDNARVGKGVLTPDYGFIVKDCAECIIKDNSLSSASISDRLVLKGNNSTSIIKDNIGV